MMGPRQVDQAARFYEFSLERHVPATWSLKMTGAISGLKLPDSKLAQDAAELVRINESEMLFSHSVRA
jgi:hypothetical protein